MNVQAILKKLNDLLWADISIEAEFYIDHMKFNCLSQTIYAMTNDAENNLEVPRSLVLEPLR